MSPNHFVIILACLLINEREGNAMAYKIETLFFALGLIIFSGRVIAASHEQNQDKPVITRRSAARMKVARPVVLRKLATAEPDISVKELLQNIAKLDAEIRALEHSTEKRGKRTALKPISAPTIVLPQTDEQEHETSGKSLVASPRLLPVGGLRSASSRYLTVPTVQRPRRVRQSSSQSAPFAGSQAAASSQEDAG